MDYFNEINTALNNISESFKPNELAYLALTSKIELPIRDRLAYGLHTKFEKENIIVAREWNLFDLCILKENRPVVLCELKAGYSFDSVFTLSRYQDLIQKDIEKMRRYLKQYDTEPDCFIIFLLTHVKQKIDINYKGVIKYLESINRFLSKDNNDNLSSNTSIIIKNGFNYKPAEWGIIKCGKAFNLEVEIFYWFFLLKQ